MKRTMHWAWLVLFAVGCGGDANSQTKDKGGKKDSSATVNLKTLDYNGIQSLIKSHKGKIVVMDCWSTSCEPCKEEFPGLVALHQKYGDQVACISLSFDYDGTGKPEDVKEQVLKFLREQKATFDNVLTSFASDYLYGKLKFASIPAVFLYDRDGKLIKMFDNSESKSEKDNFTYKKDVEPKVAELVKK